MSGIMYLLERWRTFRACLRAQQPVFHGRLSPDSPLKITRGNLRFRIRSTLRKNALVNPRVFQRSTLSWRPSAEVEMEQVDLRFIVRSTREFSTIFLFSFFLFLFYRNKVNRDRGRNRFWDDRCPGFDWNSLKLVLLVFLVRDIFRMIFNNCRFSKFFVVNCWNWCYYYIRFLLVVSSNSRTIDVGFN